MDKQEQQVSCIRGGKKIAVFFTVGVLFVLAAVTFYPMIDSVIKNKIDQQLVLKPGSSSFKQWKEPPIPIYLQFFIFNVVNEMEAKNGSPLVVAQQGPYSYREYRRKENITWCQMNSTVTYNEKQWFVFDPATSCNTCDPYKDVVTTVNVPLVTLAGVLKNLKDTFHWKELVTLLFDEFSETLFEKRTVHEMLWGYNDTMLMKYNEYRDKFHLSGILPAINPTIALQKNNTYQGLTSVSTGVKDINSIVEWQEWKGKHSLGVWNSSYANMINGTDGTQFSPGISTDDTLFVFVTQLCRSLFLTYDKSTTIHGIDTYQFTTPSSLYLNASLNGNNAAFCTKKCYPTGILDISVCQDAPISIPLFVSAPHFYLGDPSLRCNIKGLSPSKEEHGTFLDVETDLGIPLSSGKRLQINIFIEPVEDIKQTQGLGSLFLPILYINETATIDSATADMIKGKVLLPFKVAHGVEFAVIAIGLVL
ncbi:predicted protein, partial [Nematostella vectensis]